MRLLYKAGPMESLRKWFYKPKRDDHSLLAQFFFADDALNMVAAELDSFDGRKDPDRCTTLVNQLRHAQDRVLNITSQIMDQVLGDERVARGFRVKFPEDVLQDNLAGQLWFGAECLAAGSSIINRDEESAAMRPLAKALTRSLETVRSLLREQCLRPRGLDVQHDEMLHESLKIFDRLFAKFELCYVSAMVNVKTPHEFEAQQLICVLFSETLSRALKQGLLTQEQVDSYDPALMFAVPRLAIVSGLLIYSSGPLSIDKLPGEMSDMFRPFRALLHKIRTLLWTLERRELQALERLLATNEHLHDLQALLLTEDTNMDTSCPYPDIAEFVSRFYADHSHCRDVYSMQQSTSSQEIEINEGDYLPDNIDVMTPIIEGLKQLEDNTQDPIIQTTEPLIPKQEHSNEKCTQDTFQNSEEPKSRKTSKSDSNDFSSLRNLSTSGLMMFDPLVLNAVSHASTSNENNWPSPDQNLVSSLNEQVSEIADRLSSIATSDSELNIEHNQIHSFSTNDVPALISTDCDNEAYGFSGPRNDQMSCLPSTSHGYLIPNAISQEPVILASLSHNNSAVFNAEDENNDNINPDLSLMIPDSDIEIEVLNTNITIANANLSSLLLTNEEFRQNFLEENIETPDSEDVSFHSAKSNEVKTENEPVKFFLGYESDNNEVSPGDSGVSTENTSLDRSPDTDQNKEVKLEKVNNHYMQQNRVLQTDRVEAKHSLENSFSEQNENGDVTVNLNFVDDSVTQKNEATSSKCVDKQIDCKEKCDNNSKDSENEDLNLNRNSRIEDEDKRKKVRQRRNERDNLKLFNDRSEERSIDRAVANTSSGRSKIKKSSAKIKKKKSKWSPAMVILDNRSTYQHNDIVKLNLDHFVNDSNASLDCADDEEIALALQAQELAARQQARSKFKSSEDLIHRLFVCIAGVADQLQTNFAADLRNILKSVFLMNQTPDKPETPPPEDQSDHEKVEPIEYEPTEDSVIRYGSSFDSVYSAEEVYADSSSDSAGSDGRARTNTDTMRRDTERRSNDGDERTRIAASLSVGDLSQLPQSQSSTVERAPDWVPDIAAPDCMRCAAHFTAFRRRHHCRNCGKVFCASCSSNSIPLPKFGQLKPVRVCEECFRAIAVTCRRPTLNNVR